MKAIRLRTEYLKNPIGIDIAQPQLFWNCQGDCAQTAYRIIAKADGETVWDSGKVDSPSMRAQWNGAELGSRRHITWQVQLWNENGEAGELSEEAHFKLGLLKPSDWKAHWICGKYKVNKRKRYPVDCFRKLFSVEDFQKARLYITACGLYEAKLNGVRVGNFVMAPGLTDYRKRVQYQTYDVTELIQGGENAVEVMLADGWYRGSCGAWGLRNQYGKETKLLAQLEITDSNGNVHIIYTDESWDWSNDGPIRFADNKDGEVYDASAIPSYNKKAKKTSHSVVPTASNNVPVTEHERFTPSLIITPPASKCLTSGRISQDMLNLG